MNDNTYKSFTEQHCDVMVRLIDVNLLFAAIKAHCASYCITFSNKAFLE